MAVRKFIVGGDAAAVCAFDPAALPRDFDRQLEADTLGVLEDLKAKGQFWYGQTDGDGDYVCHVYLDEPFIPDEAIKARIVDQSAPQAIACPAGGLWFCGTEYAAKSPRKGSVNTPEGGLAENPVGKRIRLAKGNHMMSVIRIDNEGQPSRNRTGYLVDGIIQLALVGISIITGFFAVIFGSATVLAGISAGIEKLFKLEGASCFDPMVDLGNRAAFTLVLGLVWAVSTWLLVQFNQRDAAKHRRKTWEEQFLATPDFVFSINTTG
jgi:hypothetical protein